MLHMLIWIIQSRQISFWEHSFRTTLASIPTEKRSGHSPGALSPLQRYQFTLYLRKDDLRCANL